MNWRTVIFHRDFYIVGQVDIWVLDMILWILKVQNFQKLGKVELVELDWKHLEPEAERVVRAIAPEFKTTPLYLVPISATDFASGMSGTTACTSPTMDMLLRPFVQWKGRGVAVLFDRAVFDDPSEYLATILHEVGHALVGDFIGGIDGPIPSIFERHQPLLLKMVVDDLRERPTMPEEPVGDSHGPPWLRTALHLRHRASWLADWNCSVGSVSGYAADSFTIRPYDLHRVLLATNEYERHIHSPFAEIIRLPFPMAEQAIEGE